MSPMNILLSQVTSSMNLTKCQLPDGSIQWIAVCRKCFLKWSAKHDVVIGIADKSIAIAMLRHLLNLQNYLYTPNQKSLRKWQNVQISCSDINSHQATFVMLKICLWSCIGSIIFGVHAPGRTWNLFEWYQSIGTI